MKRGFTLIELLVVIAIIALLSAVVLAALSSARTKARDARRLSDFKQIELAIELYFDAAGYYPPLNNVDSAGAAAGSPGGAYTLAYGYTASYGYNTATNIPGCGNFNRWCALQDLLEDYIKLPVDPINTTASDYFYTAVSDGTTTALTEKGWSKFWGAQFLAETALDAALNDGGYYSNRYEMGTMPTYCMKNYSGTGREWYLTKGAAVPYSWNNVCNGGN